MAARVALLDFPWNDFSCFLSTLMLPTKFQVNWPFGSGEEANFQIGMILAIFYLQVTPMLPTKFRVDWLRSVGGVGF